MLLLGEIVAVAGVLIIGVPWALFEIRRRWGRWPS
jgi:hypothetical protein